MRVVKVLATEHDAGVDVYLFYVGLASDQCRCLVT